MNARQKTMALALLGICSLAMLAAPLARAKSVVGVSGLGWLHDWEMRVSLARLMNTGGADGLNANTIEDGAVILSSALAEEGFQRPEIWIEVVLADGAARRFAFDPTFANPIPRPLSARSVTFVVKPGVRWHVTTVHLTGLSVFTDKRGQAYFRSEGTLLNAAAANAYSKSRLNRAENALLDDLKRQGYAEATVRAEAAEVDERTGAVTVAVAVSEGPRWEINRVQIKVANVTGVTLPDPHSWEHGNWTPTTEQDIGEAVRVAFYRAGYPDVGVRVATEPGATEGKRRSTSLVVTVVPGHRVAMGLARFEGNEVTRDSVLQRRVSLKPGEPLNPIELEHARYRISRLGVFESVDMHYQPPDADTRDPVFAVKEGPRYETNLLFGYGSYEQFRGGVEYRQMNILGLAHQSRLLLVQSVKSTRGEYTYTVPELFGETIDGSAKLFGLQRREIAFLRQEYGTTLSLRRAITQLHGEATLGYTFEALRNRKSALSSEATDEKQLNVASIDFGLTTDHRDNALRPRQGYHASLQTEFASPNLGGVAQYQRTEISGAYHTPWGKGRWIHVGFSHGLITTLGASNDHNLPVNKRFFPGGDNSIRGYRMGEAAPRGADGRFLGAKTYALLNLELEQALTRNWSVVAFTDALGTAASLRDYPFSEKLYSVGLGIRYQTIVGPVRLEYGRNVNPRPSDPRGTLQISIGYPF